MRSELEEGMTTETKETGSQKWTVETRMWKSLKL